MFDFLANAVLTGGASTSTIDWTSIVTSSSFSGLLDGITDVLPIVVPVALTIAGIPVVWRLVKKFMRG